MQFDLSDDEFQVVLNGLAELPAKLSFNLLNKLVLAKQAGDKLHLVPPPDAA